MQTLLKASTEEPRAQEVKDDGSTSDTVGMKRGDLSTASGPGWDAFEVWRTRVAAFQTPVRGRYKA